MDIVLRFPAVVSAVAMVMDLGTDRVDNGWLAFSAGAGVLLHLLGGPFPSWRSCLSGMLLPLVLLGPFFCLGLLGAGDVKLLCVLGLCLGDAGILSCMFASFLLGGAYAILILVREARSRSETIHFTIPICLSMYLHLGGVF